MTTLATPSPVDPLRRSRALVTLDTNVYDAALGRIRWLYDEFDGQVAVSCSGGKDSTVVLELAAIVAAERGQLPLKVHYLDQEAEWQATRDYMRNLKDNRPDVDLDWYQCPFRLSNNTSYEESWGRMWDPDLTDDDYVRPREPDTIHVNPFPGVDRFYPMLEAINIEWAGACLTGMRAEESPNRRAGLTQRPSYKWVTWAKKDKPKYRYTVFHPIYDWSYRDVWKAINDHGWPYNRVYDQMFTYGITVRNMRVSSLTHVEAMKALNYVQELEPETWVNLTRRFPGINAYAHIGKQIAAEYLKRRPYMFDTWTAYLDYLIENLVPPPQREDFRRWKVRLMKDLWWMTEDRINQQMLGAVLRMDYYPDSSLTKFQYIANLRAQEWERVHGPLTPRSLNHIPIVRKT